MKTFRIALVDKCIDISMPIWIFFFFKRFHRIEVKNDFRLKGKTYGAIYFDEADFK